MSLAGTALVVQLLIGSGLLVLQSDFGLRDQAVAAMRGVARGVDATLVVDDLTHEIPAFDVWEAAYRLDAVVDYWPKNTVFVSVVDPGVGTERHAVAARLRSGHVVVTPDNGTLTLLADRVGIDEVRIIDAARHRLPGSERSYTFHGRDLFAHVGALLATGRLSFEDVGRPASELVRLPYERPSFAGNEARGGISVLDPQYGNVWTNVPEEALARLGVAVGDELRVTIWHEGAKVYEENVPYARTFADVPRGSPLVYVNSVGNLALALNLGNFADEESVGSGPGWRVAFSAAKSSAATVE